MIWLLILQMFWKRHLFYRLTYSEKCTNSFPSRQHNSIAKLIVYDLPSWIHAAVLVDEMSAPTSIPSASKSAWGNSNGVDRLSSLCDELLHHVMSFLPMPEAGAELCRLTLMHMHQGQRIFLVVIMSLMRSVHQVGLEKVHQAAIISAF